jgi:hypothetical protein
MCISKAEILSRIPEQVRSYFVVATADLLKDRYFPIVQAFWDAANALIPACRLRHALSVVFGFAPFRMPMGSGHLTFEPASGVLNANVENFIFLDCDKMLSIVTKYEWLASLRN